MVAGMQILNDELSVLVADTNPNYHYKQKGSGVSDTNGLLSVSIAGNSPLIAFRSASPTMLRSQVTSGGTTTFRLHTSTGGQTVQWWAFDVYPAPSGNVGLQVFDGQGRCTFDSSGRFAIVAGSLMTGSSWTTQSVTMPSGRNHAALVVHPGIGNEWDNDVYGYPPNEQYRWKMRDLFAGVAVSGQTFTASYWPGPWQLMDLEYYPHEQIIYAPIIRTLILDVTGY